MGKKKFLDDYKITTKHTNHSKQYNFEDSSTQLNDYSINAYQSSIDLIDEITVDENSYLDNYKTNVYQCHIDLIDEIAVDENSYMDNYKTDVYRSSIDLIDAPELENIYISTPDKQPTENATGVEKPESFIYEFYRKLLSKYDFKSWKEQIYVYFAEEGRFVNLNDHKLKILIRTGWDDKIQARLSKNVMIELIERIKTDPHIQVNDDFFNCYEELINFRNGILNLKTREFTLHSPDYRFTTCINADYNISPPISNTFINFVKTCVQGDSQKECHLQEIFGFCLSNFTTVKKSPFIIGAPHSGKSLLLRIIGKLIGNEHVAHVPLHRLGERFVAAHLSSKRINICSELNDEALSNLEVFKSYLGQDEIMAEFKGKDHFSYTSRIKMVFSGNQMPSLKNAEMTSAFFDRLTFINFNYSVPEKDRNHKLEEILLTKENKSYMVYWAVEGAIRLMKRNFIFSECDESVKFKKKYISEQNHVEDFIKNNCTIEPSSKVHAKTLFDRYICYCHENCLTSYDRDKFFKEVSKYNVLKRKFRLNGSKPLWGYEGIGIKQVE